MVGALAHDLRTPITALRLRLEFLPADDNTRAMRATLDDMARMSEESLTFCARKPPRPSALLTSPRGSMRWGEDYRAAGAEVVFEPGPRIKRLCLSVAIKRALRNIIDNALAYGRRVEIALAEQAPGLVITVADDGPGITEDDMAQVFDPFVRLENRAAARPAPAVWACRSRAR